MNKYQYYLHDQNLSFEKGVAVLAQAYPGRVFTGWPAMDRSREGSAEIVRQLEALGIATRALPVDREKFFEFKDQLVNYAKRFANYYPENILEKSFEQFVAVSLLKTLGRAAQDTEAFLGENIVDVGAEHSPLGSILQQLFRCNAYEQDYMYKPGLHGRKIGGDASHIPVADGFFASAIVQCALEHFEQQADISFFTETTRILKTGGTVIVVPFYLAANAFYATDPTFSIPGEVEFPENIPIHCVEGWKNRHGRHYSARSFYERVTSRLQEKMKFTVYHIESAQTIAPSVYCRFVLVGEKIGEGSAAPKPPVKEKQDIGFFARSIQALARSLTRRRPVR